MFSDEKMNVGDMLDLTLFTPEGEEIEATVRVAWVNALTAGGDAAFDVGLHFERVDPKHAERLTRHLAVLLGPDGVTVNAISPGMMETERTASLLGDATKAALVGRTPVRRLGRPADIQAAVVFLASPGGSFVTGHNLVLDGGFSLL